MSLEITVVAVVLAVLVLAVLVWAGRRAGKSLWDGLQLLVIPFALAGVAFFLNAAQSDRDQASTDRRAATDRSIVLDGAREEALHGYLQQMSEIVRDGKLLRRRTSSEVRLTARTLTLTVLRRLDGRRKAVVLQFLGEAGLIRGPSPKVDLVGADLRYVVARDATFERPEFQGADLRGADFRGATLNGPNFFAADLRGARFQRGAVRDAEFRGTDLRRATFDAAEVRGASFDFVCLSDASFRRVDFSHLTRLVHGNIGAVAVSLRPRTRRTTFVGSFGKSVDFARARLKDADVSGLYLKKPIFDPRGGPQNLPDWRDFVELVGDQACRDARVRVSR